MVSENAVVIRVVLADDEPVVRLGVREVLDTTPDIEVVAEAEDGRAAVELVLAHRPDVAVLDVRMPRLDGLDAAARIRREQAGCAVVILTTFADDAYISRVLDEGAGGFVLKTGDPQEIIAGVRAVGGGAAYLSPLVARRVVDWLARAEPRRAASALVATLTDRERKVLRLVGAGLSDAEIAGRLRVVEGMVTVYVSDILKRLDVRNRVQAAVLAYEAGLVSGTAI